MVRVNASPLAALVDLVAEHGMDRDRAATIAVYVADRCAGISLASAHSSGHAALRNDEFLTGRLAMSRPQISAWLALVRGTRPVHRRGRIVGGHPGFVEATVRGSLDARQRQRFEKLARCATGGQPVDGCCATEPEIRRAVPSLLARRRRAASRRLVAPGARP